MNKLSQTQLVEFLLDRMPELRSGITTGMNTPESKLFAIWKNEDNTVGKRTYKKPDTVSQRDIESMSKEGLIRLHGDKVEITSKGSKVIKTMILGDDRSSFSKDKNNIDYRTAEKNIKASAMKRAKKAEDDWWNRLTN